MPVGVYTATPAEVAAVVRAAAAMLAVVSRRKHPLSAAASSGVSGGESRVLLAPGRGALIIIASAHAPGTTPACGEEARGSRIG